MKIAVVQHRLRETPLEDAHALADAANRASSRGAELCILPEVFALHDGAARDVLLGLLEELPGARVLLHAGAGTVSLAFVGEVLPGLEALGAPAVAIGDACFDRGTWVSMLEGGPSYLVMSPRSESDLQAEAAIELAIGLSDAVAGLVLIAECDGAVPGEAGHGGSAIVLLGEVMAEALGGDDVLIIDVMVPVSEPEPREPVPAIPTLLQQRLANHEGRHLDMGYLADLS